MLLMYPSLRYVHICKSISIRDAKKVLYDGEDGESDERETWERIKY